jgi:excisionase family DNA binding protein
MLAILVWLVWGHIVFIALMLSGLEGSMERLLTIDEVSELTRIKVCSLRKYVLHREMPFSKIGGHLRFIGAEVEAWVLSHRVVVCCDNSDNALRSGVADGDIQNDLFDDGAETVVNTEAV